MDIEKLKSLESQFLIEYALGFSNPGLLALNKKNKTAPLIAFSQQVFAKQEFLEPLLVVENMVKLVNRSPLISMFEKPKFKACIESLPASRKVALAEALKKILHGKEELGFKAMLAILDEDKLGNWPLITVFSTYYNPCTSVFIKSTVVKKVIKVLDLKELSYQSSPSIEFYQKYRQIINDLKKQVDESLSRNNIDFSTFLSLSLKK